MSQRYLPPEWPSCAAAGLDRRQVLAALGLGFAPAFAAKPPTGGGSGGDLPWSLGGNVDVQDWWPSPYVDIVKSSRGFGRHGDYDENPGLARDAAGWPLEPSENVITAAADRPGTEWPTGTWKGRFRGTGKFVPGGVIAVNGTIRNVRTSGETTTFEWVVTSAPLLILRFDGPIRDLRIVRPGASLDNAPLLHAAALNYYKQFHTLRFHGFMGQNDTEGQGEATWAQRQPAGKFHGRRSWEAMAEFFKACFQAPGSKVRGIWWNAPYRFGETDCLAMGQHLASLLPASALKFPEFSNELWNSFYLGKWTHFLGRANDAADVDYARINTPTSSDQYERVARLWTLQAARMARSMKAAFPGAFGQTLFPVLAGQFVNLYWTRELGLPWLSLPAQVADFGGLPGTYFGTLASAPYLQGTEEEMAAVPDVASMEAGLRNSFTYSLAKLPAQAAQWEAVRKQYGIARLDAYEWQLHLHGAANQAVKMAMTFAPAAGALLKDMAHAMQAAGMRQLCYLSVSPQRALATDMNSYLWPLNESFAGPRTVKGLAVAELIAETGQ